MTDVMEMMVGGGGREGVRGGSRGIPILINKEKKNLALA